MFDTSYDSYYTAMGILKWSAEQKRAQGAPMIQNQSTPVSQPPQQQPSPPPSKPWMKAKIDQRHMHKLSYEQGFIDKCAAAGVNRDALIKFAQGYGAGPGSPPIQGDSPAPPSMGDDVKAFRRNQMMKLKQKSDPTIRI